MKQNNTNKIKNVSFKTYQFTRVDMNSDFGH